jgi:hypothetical protein
MEDNFGESYLIAQGYKFDTLQSLTIITSSAPTTSHGGRGGRGIGRFQRFKRLFTRLTFAVPEMVILCDLPVAIEQYLLLV